MEPITTIFAPEAIWPYSQWMITKKTLYSSWQIGINPESKKLEDWIEKQTHQICKNLWEILKEAWFTFKEVIRTRVYLTNMKDFKTVNEIYAKYFTNKPARITVWVNELPMWALIEIELTAKHA